MPETRIGSVKLGDRVHASSSTASPSRTSARSSFISPQAEYTPPVIYSRESRSKLVFMIEIASSIPKLAAKLHPGQPVDVQLGP